MQIDPDVALGGQRGLAVVQAHAHPQRMSRRPVEGVQLALRLHDGGHGALDAAKNREEPIALSADFNSAVRRERGAQNTLVRFELSRISLAQSVHQRGRAFDVGEQQRQRAAWQAGLCACVGRLLTHIQRTLNRKP